jgi:hypothetical protein
LTLLLNAVLGLSLLRELSAGGIAVRLGTGRPATVPLDALASLLVSSSLLVALLGELACLGVLLHESTTINNNKMAMMRNMRS